MRDFSEQKVLSFPPMSSYASNVTLFAPTGLQSIFYGRNVNAHRHFDLTNLARNVMDSNSYIAGHEVSEQARIHVVGGKRASTPLTHANGTEFTSRIVTLVPGTLEGKFSLQ